MNDLLLRDILLLLFDGDTSAQRLYAAYYNNKDNHEEL